MRILLTKISDRGHRVDIVRSDGSRDTIELVTREALFHDFLHYAVEASIPTQGGFWGALAGGKMFADLNDRTGASVRELAGTLAMVEGTVGVMTGLLRSDLAAQDAVAAHRRYRKDTGQQALPWFTESFVLEVREQMRRLQGHWKATPYGGVMEIRWSETLAGVEALSRAR